MAPRYGRQFFLKGPALLDRDRDRCKVGWDRRDGDGGDGPMDRGDGRRRREGGRRSDGRSRRPMLRDDRGGEAGGARMESDVLRRGVEVDGSLGDRELAKSRWRRRRGLKVGDDLLPLGT